MMQDYLMFPLQFQLLLHYNSVLFSKCERILRTLVLVYLFLLVAALYRKWLPLLFLSSHHKRQQQHELVWVRSQEV